MTEVVVGGYVEVPLGFERCDVWGCGHKMQ